MATGGVKIEVSSEAIVSLLNSDAVAADLRRRGQAIASTLPVTQGEEWTVDEFRTDRANVAVRTGNTAAKRTSAETMALTRALDAGR